MSNAQWIFNQGGSGGGTPVTVWTPLFARDGLPTFTGSWTPTTDNSVLMWYGQLSANTGDTMNWQMWHQPGSYVLDLAGYQAPAFGIGQLLLDGVSLGTFDQYNAVDAIGTVYQPNMASYSIGSAGLHTLTVRVTGTKNPSASAFNIGVQGLFIRGGDTCHVGFPNYQPFPYQTAGVASAFINQYKSYTLYSPEFMAAEANPQRKGQCLNIVNTPYDLTPGASGDSLQQQIWFSKAGTYNFDMQVVIGTTHGVGKLTIDGVAVGTPQPAGTLRQFGAASANGNGNNGGSALVTGEVDFYDTISATPTDACITNALTGIVITTPGFHTVKMTCSGKNTAATNFSMACAGWFRRVS